MVVNIYIGAHQMEPKLYLNFVNIMSTYEYQRTLSDNLNTYTSIFEYYFCENVNIYDDLVYLDYLLNFLLVYAVIILI